ncbi:serine hydrolase domain-containing protein [Neobacillus novalis]|uniref:Serine hydrolase domain-containing protein n=2 Tax=Neobacillus novalis TaxID=220687 RepID=A0AA95MKQ7_9BACI|nr:serine hydrolase domain-containing protein [Neobacillus novalis]WHY85325.1 serine hydrolase domain-containing protein [Neobacillus novalis]
MKWKMIVWFTSLIISTAGCRNNPVLLPQNHHVSAHFETKQNETNLQRKLRSYLRANHLNGSVAIVKENQIIFHEGVGFTDFQQRIANKPATAHPIASITKLIVAASIMRLEDKQKLSIQDEVAAYIPDFPNEKKIKIIHLLNHTSGIDTPRWQPGNPKPAEIVKKIASKPIRFPAGAEWDYNDINYLILGLIVEKVSGLPLHEYIRKNIFTKASMRHSGFITEEQAAAHYSTGYLKLGNKLVAAKPLKTDVLFGCGDIYSTVVDLCLFDKALMNGNLVSKRSLKKMLTPSAKSKYGLGLYVTTDKVFSRGVVGGWESLHVYFKNKTAMAILLNVRDKEIDIHQVSNDLYKLISEAPSKF